MTRVRTVHLLERCLLHHVDGGGGERIAVRSGATELSYGRLASVVAYGAGELDARLPPGARVLLASKNQLHVGVGFLALLAAGRVPVLADPTAGTAAREIARRSEAALLVDERLLEGEEGVALGCVERWIEEARSGLLPSPPRVDRDTEAFRVFTSGTTGEPKVVVHGHHGPAAAGKAFAVGLLGIAAGDVTISTAGLPFVYALGNNFLFPLMTGASCVLPADLLLPTVLGELARHRATVLVAGPWSLEALVRLGGRADRARALRGLRLVLSAGEALPPPLFARWSERFGGEILDNLGCTEMFNSFVGTPPGEARPGRVGRPVPGYDLEVGGGPARPGARGALRVRGESRALAVGAVGGPCGPLPADGWCDTGDEVEVDDDGWLVFLGRLDDRFKVHGRFVSPVEVERRLLEVAGVVECRVGPEPDVHGIAGVSAWIVLDDAAEPAEVERRLRRHAREHLPPWTRPGRVHVVDALARSDRGKLVRPRGEGASLYIRKPGR